jgi:hypothetical protein
MIDECILKNILNTDLYDLESYVSNDNSLIFLLTERLVSEMFPKTNSEVSGQKNTLKVNADINNK